VIQFTHDAGEAWYISAISAVSAPCPESDEKFNPMRRRDFITLLPGAALAWPLATRAQPSPGFRRIGILETIPAELNKANLDSFRKGLRERGYVEGQNIALDYRSADGSGERFPELAAELVGLRVDLIVTRGTPAAQAAKNATSTIPVVMAAIGEPLGVGVVAGLARPGGNVTGLNAFVTQLAGKRVELVKELIPSLTRVALFHNMGNPVVPPQWEETKIAAQTIGVQAALLDVRSREDMVRAVETASKEKIEAVLVGIDGLLQANRQPIVDLMASHQLPAIYPSREFVDLGGLMTYGVSYPDLYFRAAGLVDKIFKGTHPSELPVEQPTKFEFIVNLKAAKAIGLTIPELFLARANEVIE
jgi:putative tryptophan/tyrosine transport system substrate-binding protein